VKAAFWVEQTVEAFGRTLAIECLSFDEHGVLQLAIEGCGVFVLEHTADSVLAYLVRHTSNADRTAYRRALQLCHHSETDLSWLQAALLKDGRLAFATRIPHNEFHLASLESAMTTLTNLHNALAEGAAV
jgi:type III secretion system chaperone SycN